MAFHLNTRDIETIVDYAHAVETYHQLKPWRGEEEVGMWRCLDTGNIRKHHVRIRLNTHSGDVECRLHSTNVVTYHENGEITIQPYESVSTNNFASAILPSDFYPWMTRESGSCMGVAHPDVPRSSSWYGEGKRFYQLAHLLPEGQTGRYGYGRSKDGLRFTKKDGWWQPHESTPPVPFDKYTLDRSRTAAVLKKHCYRDFRHFLIGMVAIARSGGAKFNLDDVDYSRPSNGEVVCMVDDDTQWVTLFKRYLKWVGSKDFTVSGMLDYVRMAIYHGEGVVVHEELPYVDSWQAIKQIDAAERKYSYL